MSASDKFRNTFENVANFEQKTGIQLPEDIASLLTSHSHSSKTENTRLSGLSDVTDYQSASSVSSAKIRDSETIDNRRKLWYTFFNCL